MAASLQTSRAWNPKSDIVALRYHHIIHIPPAWRPWTYRFYYQGYPLHPLTQHIQQPWHHCHTSNLKYTHHTITPQNALSVHNHTHLQQNITASTPQPTLQHHQPHPEQQIPLLHHADQKHQEQGVTHQTQTTPPAISH